MIRAGKVHARTRQIRSKGMQQADDFVAQMVKGRFEKLQDVVGAVRVARPQPEIGHHVRFGDQGQQWMVADAPVPLGVIAPQRRPSCLPLRVITVESTFSVTCFSAPILPKIQR